MIQQQAQRNADKIKSSSLTFLFSFSITTCSARKQSAHLSCNRSLSSLPVYHCRTKLLSAPRSMFLKRASSSCVTILPAA